jgi:hypothetical protein
MDKFDKLKNLGSMPDFRPEPLTVAPGVEMPVLTAQAESIANAFSIIKQQNRWQSNAIVALTEAVVDLSEIVVRVEREGKETAASLKLYQEEPYRILWRTVKWLLAAGGTAIIGWLAGHFKII